MKKLLILAAAIVAGVAANAASFRWSATGVTDFAGIASYSGTASLYAYLSGDDATTAKLVSTATMTDGAIVLADTEFKDNSLSGGNIYKFYYIMEDASGNTWTSVTKTMKAQATSTANVQFGSGGSWTVVPEPTSGLLVLLGMAGLALRRCRA